MLGDVPSVLRKGDGLLTRINDERLLRSTTVLAVRRADQVAIGGDGQVTFGATVLKHHATKVRRMYRDEVLVGFAGSAADSLALFEKLEARLEEYHGTLRRAAVELAKDWRSDRVLRRLEAQMIACDRETSMLITGNGDVLVPDDGVLAIGSGSATALGAARALLRHVDLNAEAIVRASLEITAEVCIYTNAHFSIERLDY
jgi:ATP-dependent HslUV protease subunit HslV